MKKIVLNVFAVVALVVAVASCTDKKTDAVVEPATGTDSTTIVVDSALVETPEGDTAVIETIETTTPVVTEEVKTDAPVEATQPAK